MTTELELCSSNIHILLIIAIVVCISLYFFIEVKKIKQNIRAIEDFINYPGKDNAPDTSFFDKLINPLKASSSAPPKPLNISPLKPSFMNEEYNINPNKTEAIPKDIVLPEQSDLTITMDQLNQDISQQMKPPSENDDSTTNCDAEQIDRYDESSDEDDISTLCGGTDIGNDLQIDIDAIIQGDLSDDDLKEDDLKEDDLKEDDLKEDDDEEGELEEGDLEEGELEEGDLEEGDLKEGDLEEGDDEVTLKSMTVNELKSILIDLQLPVSGNKTKLIKRIIEDTAINIK